MRKLRSILITMLCLLMCSLLIMPSIFATQTTSQTQTVYDYAELLTSSEINDLETQIAEIKSTYNTDVYLLTTNDAQGKTSTAYADDFFFDLGYGRNGLDSKAGILLLIDMDNRNVWISTSGKTISYFTDARIQLVIDEFYDQLTSGEYYNVFKIFLDTVSVVVSNPIPSTPHEETSLPRAPLTTTDYLLRGTLAALIAFIVSLITYFCICRSYTHPKFTKPVASPDRSTIDFTDKKDQFVHTHTTRVRINNDDNSSGGGGSSSSTHTSSGGGTFGGGGRSF